MELNYVVDGDGETILFIHGLSDNLVYWETLVASLKKDYRIIRVDLRGHGQTPLGDEEITIGGYSEDLKNLLDDLDVDRINLAGFSLGGAVALDFTVNHPEMVSSLVLMSTFSKCDDYLEEVFAEFKSSLHMGFEEFYDYMIPRVLCPEVIENNAEELEMLKQISSESANLEAYIKAADACLNFNVEDRLFDITQPTLILAGKHDDICPLRYQENLNRMIENSKLVVFDNLKHNLLVGENIAKIADVIDDFLKK